MQCVSSVSSSSVSNNGVWTFFSTLLLAALLGAPGAALGLDIVIDSEALTITGDGDSDPQAFKGQTFSAFTSNGVSDFVVAGEGVFDATDSVTVVGSDAVSLVFGGNVSIASGAQFSVSAAGAAAGPGGGFRGSGGTRGSAGSGASVRSGGPGG